MKITLGFLLAGALTLTIPEARAEEKNGVGVTVSKTTIDNNDSRGTYSKSINRTQALKAVIKKVGFKPLAEAELVDWRCGRAIGQILPLEAGQAVVVLSQDGNLAGMARARGEGLLQPKLVFNAAG